MVQTEKRSAELEFSDPSFFLVLQS